MTTYPKPGAIADVIGTTGRIEATWGNAIRDRVVNEFATTADRDSFFTAPWEGACAYVTLTHTLYIYQGVGWAAFDCKPQLWTPVLTQGVTVSATVTRATYVRAGGRVHGEVRLDITSSGTALVVIAVNLPAALTAAGSGIYGVGQGVLYDSSTGVVYPFIASTTATTVMQFMGTASNRQVTEYLGTSTSDFALAVASSDAIVFSFQYDLA